MHVKLQGGAGVKGACACVCVCVWCVKVGCGGKSAVWGWQAGSGVAKGVCVYVCTRAACRGRGGWGGGGVESKKAK